MSRQRRKVRWARLIIVLVIFGFICTAIFVGLYNIWLKIENVNKNFSAGFSNGAQQTDIVNNRINILIMGVDDVADGSQGNGVDTLMVICINPSDLTVQTLFIPPDTRVGLTEGEGARKIMSTYLSGGESMTIRTVQTLLNIPIHHYLVFKWQGVRELVDSIGGIEMYVEQDMVSETDMSINLAQGLRKLDGQQSFQYAYYRQDELSDIARIHRQHRLCKALENSLCSPKHFIRLPLAIQLAKNHLHTDLNWTELIKIGNILRKSTGMIDNAEIVAGEFKVVEGNRYWIINKEMSKRMVERKFLPQP